MAETWTPVRGHEEAYEVSDSGRVRSLARVVQFRDGRTRRFAGREIKASVAGQGYLTVHLWAGNVRTTATVHRLVADAFHGPAPTPMHHVLHGDGDPLNNRADNLRWGTPADNSDDARRHGTRIRGERVAASKLSGEDVHSIRRMWDTGLWRQKDLARKFNVNQAQVSRIVNRKNWAHAA